MRDMDIQALRQAFSDNRVQLCFGLVRSSTVNGKKSAVMVECEALGYGDPVTDTPWIIKARLGTGSVGPSSGDWDMPESEDLVLLALPDGAPDQAVVVCRLASNDEPVPTELTAATKLIKGRPDQQVLVKTTGAGNIDLHADQGHIHVGSPTSPEPLVLGNVMVTFMTAVLNAFLNAAQVGQSAMGPVMLDPDVRSALNSAMSTYLQTASSNILSQKAYTERGGS